MQEVKLTLRQSGCCDLANARGWECSQGHLKRVPWVLHVHTQGQCCLPSPGLHDPLNRPSSTCLWELLGLTWYLQIGPGFHAAADLQSLMLPSRSWRGKDTCMPILGRCMVTQGKRAHNLCLRAASGFYVSHASLPSGCHEPQGDVVRQGLQSQRARNGTESDTGTQLPCIRPCNLDPQCGPQPRSIKVSTHTTKTHSGTLGYSASHT